MAFHFIWTAREFEYKTNPNDQARSPSARIWRKREESLKFKCTAKGKKEGGIFVNFMIGIAYGKGVVLFERWMGTMTGEKFASYYRKALFQQSISKISKSKR